MIMFDLMHYYYCLVLFVLNSHLKLRTVRNLKMIEEAANGRVDGKSERKILGCTLKLGA